ncbi:MAG: cyclic nucleotide-binding domain-containing protein [Burkholderiales bacterium]
MADQSMVYRLFSLFGWDSIPSLLLLSLMSALLSFRFLPAERKDVKNSLLFIVFSLAGLLASEALRLLGLTGVASALHEVFLIIQGIAIIRLWGIFVFRLLLPLVHLSPPRIVDDLLTFAAYLVWGMVRLRYAGMDLSGIVTTSAVVTAVVAFSMQDTLGNILGGIALQLDKSVQVGDWIKADDVVGRVVDIRWRSTVVETRNWETVVIPNSHLMKNKFSVLGRRSGEPVQLRRWIWFNVDFKEMPARVIRTAEEAVRGVAIPCMAQTPAPNCVLMDFEKNYGHYALRYWLTDLAVDDPTDTAVRLHLFAALQRKGIRLAFPEEGRHIIKESEKHEQVVRQRDLAHRLSALKKVELFAGLNSEELQTVAERLVYAPFAKGDVLTRQGAVAHWLYILTGGEVEVIVETPGQGRRPLSTLQAGSFFGEMGLLTGDPRSSTVVALNDVECYRLDKGSVQDILLSRPAMAEEFSRILAERRVELDSLLQDIDAASRERRLEDHHSDILRKIRQFFSLSA